MNELLGWYGYEDSERPALPKTAARSQLSTTRTSASVDNSSMTSINSTISLIGRRKSSSTDERDCGTTSPESPNSPVIKPNGRQGIFNFCLYPYFIFICLPISVDG